MLGSEESLLVSFINTLTSALGEVGIAILIAIENIFPPIPSEVILPLAGFSASFGQINLILAILFSTIGSLLGSLVLYYLGAWLGRRRFYLIIDKIPLVRIEDIEKTEEWFNKHGKKAIFFGRLIPIFRSLISIPAGIIKMPHKIFIPLTFLGSLIWNTVLILAGYALGQNYNYIEGVIEKYQYIVILLAVAIVALYIIWRIKQIRQGKKKADVDPDISK